MFLCVGLVIVEEDFYFFIIEEGAEEGVVIVAGVVILDLGRGYVFIVFVSSFKVEEIRYCMISFFCFMLNFIILVIWNYFIL